METKDLNHAAFLMAKGCNLKSCTPDMDNRFWFTFDETVHTNIDDLTEGYYMNTCEVSPQAFINAQKTLKNVIRNYKPTRTV